MIRGDIYWAELDPAIGSEMNSKHPALIISNDISNRASSVVIVAPISSTKATTKSRPYFVFLNEGEGGLKRDSFIHCGQIRVLDKTRLVEKIGSLTDLKMIEVNRALFVSLALF